MKLSCTISNEQVQLNAAKIAASPIQPLLLKFWGFF